MTIGEIVIVVILVVGVALTFAVFLKMGRINSVRHFDELKEDIERLGRSNESDSRRFIEHSTLQSESTARQISEQGDRLRGYVVNTMSELGRNLSDNQEKQQNAASMNFRKLEGDFENIRKDMLSTLEKIRFANTESMEKLRAENQQSLDSLREYVVKTMSELGRSLTDGQERQQKTTSSKLESLENNFTVIRKDILDTLEKVRSANTESMEKLRDENRRSLDKINDAVNEKLQKTLDDRIAKSFETVNQRLKEVYEGLGEMKTVASGVSDLKNVLSNVKTRGILGEIQLGAILREILSQSQYGEQIAVKPDSAERVDFAVKLPGADDGHFVYLPIDSKFPGDTYRNLLAAYESGNATDVKTRRSNLEFEIKRCAKSISEKYIAPPYTTEFAIMFLPFEGLYAEVVNMGLVEVLQSEYKVNIAGPSTMAAMLNSLQMGFRTLAIQKKSGDIRVILEAAKKEFLNFEEVLTKTRERLRQADDELEKLVGVRTKRINRALEKVALPDSGQKPVQSAPPANTAAKQ